MKSVAVPEINAVSEPATRLLSGHVLVVDDNDANRDAAVRILERLGIHADSAEDGQQAVMAVHSQQYDLVLMDCQMPIFDGYEATAAIRLWEAEDGRETLPIVALTASAFAEDRERCGACGMNDFLAKPVNLAAMRQMMERWLPAKEAGKTTPPRRKSRDSVRKSTSDSSSGTAELHIDREQFNEMRLLIGAGFPEFVAQFHIIVRDGLTVMRAASLARDAATLKRTARKLKGSAGTLGIKSVARQCASLESMARSGNMDSVAPHVEHLHTTYAELCDLLEKVA